MPVLHERNGTDGVYLKANIDGSIVTLQVRRTAEGLLNDLGYTDESTVPWQIVIPLQIIGHIYTKGSGSSETDDSPEMTESFMSRLSNHQKKKFNEYLSRCPGLTHKQVKKINRFFGSGTASASEKSISTWTEFSSKYSPDTASKERDEKVSSLHDIYVSVTGDRGNIPELPPNQPVQPRTDAERKEAFQLIEPSLSENEYVGTVEIEMGTYGFINATDYDQNVFFHQSFIDGWEIEEGTIFVFEIEQNEEGPKAANMEFVNPWSKGFNSV